MDEQMREWALRVLFPEKYIFFRSRKDQGGFCTGCGQWVDLESPEHRVMAECPRCGKAMMVGSWYGRKWMMRLCECIMVQPLEKGVLVREAYMHLDFENEKPRLWLEDTDVAIFADGGFEREVNVDYRGWRPVKSIKRKSREKWVMTGDLDGTQFENCPVREFVTGTGLHPSLLLRLYQRKPKVEHLVRAGLYEVVKDVVHGKKGINWSGRRPRDMLGLSNPETKTVAKRQYGLDAVRIYKQYPGLFDLEQDERILKYICNNGILHQMKEELFEEDVKYIRRQMQKIGTAFSTTYILLRDTRRMLEETGHEMIGQNLYPPKLQEAHDRAMQEKRAMEREEKEKQWEREQPVWDRIAKKLSPLCWEDGGLLIRPVASRLELVREGDILEHCVATYAERLKREDSYILLIRKTDEPDKPYFTLNLSPDGKIIQCHGYKNDRFLQGGTRPDEIKDFEQRWMREKVTKWLKTRRKGA